MGLSHIPCFIVYSLSVGLWQRVNRLWPFAPPPLMIMMIIESYSCYRTNKSLMYFCVMYKMETCYTSCKEVSELQVSQTTWSITAFNLSGRWLHN